MKNRYSNDPRVSYANGYISRPRIAVIEALEAQAGEGATIDELVTLVGEEFPGKRPKGSIGQVLGYMHTDEIAVCVKDRWYLKEHAPAERAEVIVLPHANGGRAQVAPLAQKRTGKTVSLYSSPRILDNVIGVSLLIGERWYKIPLFASVRICTGHESPLWSPEQEVYSDVSVIKVLFKDGRVHEERPAGSDLVTIAPE